MKSRCASGVQPSITSMTDGDGHNASTSAIEVLMKMALRELEQGNENGFKRALENLINLEHALNYLGNRNEEEA